MGRRLTPIMPLRMRMQQQIRVGQVRVQLLDQVEVGSMLMDERTECLVVHRWIG